MSVLVEQLAARYLREYLLAELPAKVTAVNLERAPVLKAARAGPYTISGTKRLSISKTGVDSGYLTTDAFAAGSQTAAQIAATIEGSTGLAGVATADAEGRLVLTGAVPSGASTNGVIAAKDSTTGTAALFGWAPGGEKVVQAPLVAPGYKGVADGLPMTPDMGPGFWVIIGKRMSQPVARSGSTVRTYEYQVGLELAFMYQQMEVQSHRSREAIGSCVRCVRELLLTSAGRQLGRGGPEPKGDVVLVEEKQCTIEGTPFAFKGKDQPPGLFDRALMLLSIRMFERAAS